jgi:hypothetical protein
MKNPVRFSDPSRPSLSPRQAQRASTWRPPTTQSHQGYHRDHIGRLLQFLSNPSCEQYYEPNGTVLHIPDFLCKPFLIHVTSACTSHPLASLPNRPNHHFSFSRLFSELELLGLPDRSSVGNLGGKSGASGSSPSTVRLGPGLDFRGGVEGTVKAGVGGGAPCTCVAVAGGGVSVLGIIPASASGVLTNCGIDRLSPSTTNQPLPH